ncbi:MAG: hypothetical protein WBR24_03510 [Desulfobacterales bacterium]|jgi:hypothetical protein
MNLNSIIAVAWVAGMMVSPEALILQGHIAGTNGPTFFIAILSAMALFMAILDLRLAQSSFANRKPKRI